jgi:DNA-binding NarL/FixJ family response regulator/GAF domain-containing protein
VAVYSRDVSARRRQAEQQALVAELGQRALAGDDLQSLMDEAVGLVAGTLDVALAGVGELTPGTEEVIFRAGCGWREGVVGSRIDHLVSDSLLGYTLRVREPVTVADMPTDRRFRASTISRDHRVLSALSVMIESPDEPFGALGVFSTRPRSFSRSEVSFAQAVANVLASAVERSRAQERLIDVREVERRRIARGLHEEALQDLTHALALAGADGPDELTAALERVGEQLRGAIYDLRLGGRHETPFPELLEALVAVHGAMAPDRAIELDVREGAAQQVRVLLVEDHTAVRQAIAAMFEREADFTVAGQARSLAEARELLDDVDVAVLDLGLPDGDGTDLIAELREASPEAQALVLSAGLDRAQTARAIESGAAAALDKTADLGQVIDTVRRLRAGETLLATSEVAELLRFAGHRREQEREDRQALDSLTPREREVLRALAAGLESQAIADQLGISIRTERNHVARILSKLGVHSQLQAVLFALRYVVIKED